MANSSKSLMAAGGPFKSTLGHFTISVAAPTSSTSPATAVVTITSTQNWKGGVNITYSIQSGSSVAISPSSEQVSIPSNGSVQRGVTLQAYQSEPSVVLEAFGRNAADSTDTHDAFSAAFALNP